MKAATPDMKPNSTRPRPLAGPDSRRRAKDRKSFAAELQPRSFALSHHVSRLFLCLTRLAPEHNSNHSELMRDLRLAGVSQPPSSYAGPADKHQAQACTQAPTHAHTFEENKVKPGTRKPRRREYWQNGSPQDSFLTSSNQHIL